MYNIRQFYWLRGLYKADSTNPESFKADEYELMRGTCFVARRLDIVAVAGVLWISLCVLSVVGYRIPFLVLFTSNAQGLLQV